MDDGIGAWRIRDFAPGEGVGARAVEGAGEGWIAASAPGDTYLALIAAGRLAHPYEGRSEAAAEWVREREYWWHAPLELGASDDESVELVFDGLDTFADIYLDGALVGRADNMFRTGRVDLSAIAPGRHDLALCFHPTDLMTQGDPPPTWPVFADRVTRSRRTLMRKAQFGWGWDWGPDLPTVGIWQPVRIERRRGPAIRSLNASTLAIEDGAATVEIDVETSAPAPVHVTLLDPDGAIVGTATCAGAPVTLTVANPRLWWTADLGDQPLYTLVARTGDGEEIRRRIGIRTIAIDQSPDPDEPGATFFRFVLNGVPIFAKGANWVPASSFVAEVPDGTIRDLLERSVAANMNMIRVWGGGIYEPDAFYDECDRLGLLVWQDFMFACAPYPDHDPAFVENVRLEVREQAARLRHHACIALWCGNNENQAIQFFADHATGKPEPLVGQSYYDELIPAVLAEIDPHTPYWPGSPWGGPSPNSMRGGDVHNWTVWHGVQPVPDDVAVGEHDTSPEGLAFTRYAEDMARFVSEFGIQGAPDIGTLKRWMAPEDLAMDSEGFLERIKDAAGKAIAMTLPVTGAPTSLADYVDFTMLTQAEGLVFGIEHFRRRTPHCSGALIWQLNDCWPCVSWSLIDYDGVAKQSWYAVARAFAPVLASFRRDGDVAELWITNDRREPFQGKVAIALAQLYGSVDGVDRVNVDIPAGVSMPVWRGWVPDCVDQVLTVRSESAAFPANRLLLAPVHALALEDAGLTVVSRQTSEGLAMSISAERYALAVRLRSDDPALRFSDNGFDLAGGERHEVLVSRKDGVAIDPDAIEVSCWNRRNG